MNKSMLALILAVSSAGSTLGMKVSNNTSHKVEVRATGKGPVSSLTLGAGQKGTMKTVSGTYTLFFTILLSSVKPPFNEVWAIISEAKLLANNVLDLHKTQTDQGNQFIVTLNGREIKPVTGINAHPVFLPK